MSFVEWTPELEVGSPEMDAQHRRLIAIINEYHESLSRGASNAELERIFTKVAEFATYHFRDEEALMERHGFPQLARHRLIHRQLVERVGELMAELHAGREGVSLQIQYFLKNWLTAHIKGVDCQYRTYVSGAARSAPAASAAQAH